jgi:hypothetical protein
MSDADRALCVYDLACSSAYLVSRPPFGRPFCLRHWQRFNDRPRARSVWLINSHFGIHFKDQELPTSPNLHLIRRRFARSPIFIAIRTADKKIGAHFSLRVIALRLLR